MSGDVDLGALQGILGEFRRREAEILPAIQTPHGDTQAWRLSEQAASLSTDSAG